MRESLRVDVSLIVSVNRVVRQSNIVTTMLNMCLVRGAICPLRLNRWRVNFHFLRLDTLRRIIRTLLDFIRYLSLNDGHVTGCSRVIILNLQLSLHSLIIIIRVSIES